MKEYFRTLFRIIGILIGSWGVGMIALVLVYLIPVERIDEHVKESAIIMQEEGVFPILTEYCTSQLDNWTDSTMLAKAAYNGNENILNKALMVYSERIEGMNPQKSLVEYYIYQNRDVYKSEYARYWHGYLVLLRPLLFLMDYGNIRILNGIIQTLLSLCVLYLLYRNGLHKYIIPYVVSLCFIMPLTTAKSLQYSSVYYIFTIATIILIANYHNFAIREGRVRISYFFMLIGICTSYFDFLTYPLATFGIPAIFFMCLKRSDKLKSEVIFLLKILIFWGIGYGGMWLGKWVLASIFTDYNVIINALQTILYRTSTTNGDGIHCSVLHVWNVNISAFAKNPIIVVAIIFLIIRFVQIIKKKKIKKFWNLSINYIGIAVLPLVWYVVIRNHSWLHYWFTYKGLIISALAIMCLASKCLEE